MLKKNLLKVLQRSTELLASTAALSAIVTGLNVAGFLRTRISTLIALIVGAIIFMLLNIRLSRNSYFTLRKLTLYYIVNSSAVLIYALILALVHRFGGNIIFTWMFAIAKFACYINPNITTSIAVFFFGFVLMLTIVFAPAGMKFLLMYHEKQTEDI